MEESHSSVIIPIGFRPRFRVQPAQAERITRDRRAWQVVGAKWTDTTRARKNSTSKRSDNER